MAPSPCLTLVLLAASLAAPLAAQTPTVIDDQVGADGARQGWSLSPAGDVDGDLTLDYILGEPRDDTSANSAGRARVFSGATGLVIHGVLGDSGSDQLGYAVSGIGELTGDSRAEFAAGAPFDDDNGSASGRARVYRGDTGAILFDWAGDAAGDEFGRSIADAGDVDNDTVPDIIVGAPQIIGGGLGYARIFSGATGGVIRTLTGIDAQSSFGISVDGIGDIDNDGFDDVIVGAYLDDTPGTSRGRAYIHSGQDGSVLRVHDGLVDFDWFGWSVGGAGDVNDDGTPDYIVGSYGADPDGDTSGQARVFSGVDGALLLTLDGTADNENLGWSVDGAGDVNGDGHADLIVGAPFDGAGRARIFSGADGSLLTEIPGDSSSDQRGRAVAGLGADLNGDGHPDVLVGAPLDDNNGSSSGTTLIVSGFQPWTNLGGGSPGVAGTPALVGAGPLIALSTISLSLSDGPPSALVLLWVSLASAPLPIFGGTIHAFPFSDQVLLGTDASGAFAAGTLWPPAVPTGSEVWFQFLLDDPSVIFGITLSDAVRSTAP